MSTFEWILLIYGAIGFPLGYVMARDVYKNGNRATGYNRIEPGSLGWSLVTWFNLMWLWGIFALVWIFGDLIPAALRKVLSL